MKNNLMLNEYDEHEYLDIEEHYKFKNKNQ